MLVNERLGQRKLSTRLRMPSEMTLVVTVAIAFLILHILAGVILLRTPANGAITPRNQAVSSLYD